MFFEDAPEPALEGHSVTIMNPGAERVEAMRREAAGMWSRQLAAVMAASPAPFINCIYDKVRNATGRPAALMRHVLRHGAAPPCAPATMLSPCFVCVRTAPPP